MESLPFVDLKIQYESLAKDIDRAVRHVMESANFILGPDVAAFEEEFADFCRAKYCVGVSSGTAALKLALQACDIGAGDEVIIPTNTYIATALAVSQTNAHPVLVDAGADYLIDPNLLSEAVTPKTKAVILVHLYGRAVPERIFDIARKQRLRIIEDACQAHGALSNGKRVGGLGDVGCFSFYPGKNLGAYGDGGAVVTNDLGIAESVRLLRDFGQRKKYQHLVKGDNCRLDTLQAAILRVKLHHLEAWNRQRIEAASTYHGLLEGFGVVLPRLETDGSHVYHIYNVEIPERDVAQEYLTELGIQTGIHYPVPIHLQAAYRDLGYTRGAFRRAEDLSRQTLSLPMFPEISEAQIRRVVDGIAKHMEHVQTNANARS